MPQFSLEPPVTTQELARLWELLRQEMKKRGFRFQGELAKSVGANATEISTLKNRKLTRKWGFARMRRYADYLGMSVDEMLGRPEGTTRVWTPSGRKPDSLTVGAVRPVRVYIDPREMLQREMDVAREWIAIKDVLVEVLTNGSVKHEKATELAREGLKKAEPHLLRIIELGRSR